MRIIDHEGNFALLALEAVEPCFKESEWPAGAESGPHLTTSKETNLQERSLRKKLSLASIFISAL